MSINQEDILKHARELYLHHLSERWQLIRYYILVYTAIIAGEVRLYLWEGKGRDILPCAVVLTLLLTVILWLLDVRIKRMIEVHRNILKEIESGSSAEVLTCAGDSLDAMTFFRLPKFLIRCSRCGEIKLEIICSKCFTTGFLLNLFFFMMIISQIGLLFLNELSSCVKG